ncbi:hypothetical protein KGQ20_17005 [Catenulispora sp. NF23]|uniref:hypothetical protein n=1 Tax=Catenulispora pinistramenti TaxID=2705254 RepID=UPI001BA58B70|nr:hypothetical protein [Catenulispora pinistramenti]MBS2534473.1 hypothetical protein [Catenulispora pinistramenti]
MGLHGLMSVVPGVAFDMPRLISHIEAAAANDRPGYERVVLAPPGPSYEHRLASLSSRKRWGVRRDRRRFAGSGRTISFSAGPAAMGEEIVRLQGHDKRKYG